MYLSNSSRVAMYPKSVGRRTFRFFAASLEIAKGGTAPDYTNVRVSEIRGFGIGEWMI